MYVIRLNGAWLSEIKYSVSGVHPIGSDVRQDAAEFEGLGEVIEAMREIYLWQRVSDVEVTEVCVVGA